MKKLTILLLLVLSLFGCREHFFYVEISEPHLTGGAWTFSDYHIQLISSISDVDVVYNDTICINAFGDQRLVTEGIEMGQHYNSTSPDRRFIKGVTLWEFDDNSYSLYVDGGSVRYGVDYPNYMMKEYDKMRIMNPTIGAVTNYTFESNAIGANYATELVLMSPEIVSDVLLSNGMRDKAVTVRITLIFRR